MPFFEVQTKRYYSLLRGLELPTNSSEGGTYAFFAIITFFVMKTIFKARHDKATRLSAGNAVEELYQADERDESGVQPRDWSLLK